jgi:hypothetical protein
MGAAVMRTRRHGQEGYVLLMVLAALAVMAFVVQRFAQRNDDLRRHALDFQQYADGQAAVASALAASLYWTATRPLQPAGRGDERAQLRLDGSPLLTVDGAWVSVQDVRGLLSVNGSSRAAIQALLVQDGLPVPRAQAMVDVLDDYVDTDRLKRINGAERPEYQGLGLLPPRDDWVVSLRELEGMPLWRDDLARLSRLQATLSSDVGHLFNPASAPPAALRAMFPTLSASQLDTLMRLRSQDQLRDLRAASALVGINLNEDDYILFPGNELRLRLWAPGLPRAHEYNARLTPAGELGPWVITEQHSTTRPHLSDDAPRIPPFPLAWPRVRDAAPHTAP